MIYVARNVKDCVSSYHPFLEALTDFHGTKEEFVDAFLKDHIHYQPYWEHIIEFWEMRNESNIFFTSYERMKKDLKSVLKELCVFLEKEIPSDDVLDRAVVHLSFDSMKSELAFFPPFDVI